VSSGGRFFDLLSVLGSLLFSLFIVDLCGAVLTSNYHSYAVFLTFPIAFID
jgi:hypothetical protein